MEELLKLVELVRQEAPQARVKVDSLMITHYFKMEELLNICNKYVDYKCALADVSGSACSKCNGSSFDTEYKNVGSKIYWSEHDEIKNISKFTRNDRYYSSDKIDKECIVKSCNSCGYKQAVSCS